MIKKIIGFLLSVLCLLTLLSSVQGMERVYRQGTSLPFVADTTAKMTFVPLGEASHSPWISNAFDWLNRYLKNETGVTLALSKEAKPGTLALFAAYGPQGKELLKQVAGTSVSISELPQQGFVIQRMVESRGLIVWSPSELGLRYGLIEVLRSLRKEGTTVSTTMENVVDGPDFEKRIYYVNFASHLQNAYNVNAVFKTDVYKWDLKQWFALIDNISSLRYTHFEFWLVPALMSPEVLTGGPLQAEFAATMNKVIQYAKSRAVIVHPIVVANTIGINWHYHCPNNPGEKAELLAIWEHWIKALPEMESWGIFPGDPGGCTKNGCTKKTYVDLSLEIAHLIKKHNSKASIEVGTWGEPMAGWGIPLWKKDEAAAKEGMDYLIAKLPEFPKDTFVSINRGFSPDCQPNMLGWESANCDGRVWAKAAAKICPVLTWDYSVTEGEETVYPHCRIRRQLTARHLEREAGCYSGGIAYTMSPLLQLCSQFCAAEGLWNSDQTPETILTNFARLAFGGKGESAGVLLEEFECLPGWGYNPAPFPFTPERLYNAMVKLLVVLNRDDLAPDSQLPFAVSGQQYRESLLFYATLFRDLADLSISLSKLTQLAHDAGGPLAEISDQTRFDEIDRKVTDAKDLKHRAELITLIDHIKKLDASAMRNQYWKNVYGIYDVVGAPIDPRSWGATGTLMNRFGGNRIVTEKDSPKSQLQ